MKIDIDKLTKKELVDLNHRIVERLKFLRSMHDHADMMKFSIGEKVCFNPYGRGDQVGILAKYEWGRIFICEDIENYFTVN